jgi:hypothetical protein
MLYTNLYAAGSVLLRRELQDAPFLSLRRRRVGAGQEPFRRNRNCMLSILISL